MEQEPFDTLQILFLDRCDDYLHLIGTKDNDRLFQVEVSVPNGRTFISPEDDMLKGDISVRVQNVVRACPIRGTIKSELLSRLT